MNRKQIILVLCLWILCVKSQMVSPTCALNGLPCPSPTWPVEWNLTRSTICQPGGGTGFFGPPPSQPWGLVSLDWSNAQNLWLSADLRNSTCEAVSVANCKLLKTQGTATRCFIYHNSELALEWLESQRAVMYDPTKADYFLQYLDTNGNKNGTIYNEPIAQGDQFFWDFTNPDAAAYYVSSILQAISDPNVDGTFTDDVTGVPAEHPNVQQATGMTNDQITNLQTATQETNQWLIDSLVKNNKYNWQAFGNQDGMLGNPSQSNCVAWMRQYCQPIYQSYPMALQMDTSSPNKNQTLAAFLIVRPPYGWIGWGWESDQRMWDPIFLLNVGDPNGLCTEGPTGVFSRVWSEGTVLLDCNAWNATLPFQSI